MREFLSDRRGNVAILFALTFMPLAGAVGVAMDYGLATASRTQMQAALDTTELALAKLPD
jgi:Flp pilus assembly protein TadG